VAARRKRGIGSRGFWLSLLALAVLSAGLRFSTSSSGQAFLARAGIGRAFVPRLAARLDMQLAEALARMGLVRADITARMVTERNRRVREYAFNCPQHLTPTLVHVAVERAVRAAEGEVLDAEERHARVDELVLVLGYGKLPTHRVVVRALVAPPARPVAVAQPSRPRLALIVDDLGHNLNATARGFLELGVPITVAVLPELHDSDEVFELAHERGIPALLHLPMEPQRGEDPGKHAVRVGMPADEIEALVDRHLRRYKTFFGVNNHMGSRATADQPTMQALARALRRRDLVFVDSQTTPRSVARAAAREAGIWCVANDLFLDDGEETQEQVEGNLEHLAAVARKRGLAVGIVHPHPATLAALRQGLPRLQAHGIELVTIESLRPGANVAVRATAP
jgi:polysaccharide deacetylase 2 family uncharacterized protein YibQ